MAQVYSRTQRIIARADQRVAVVSAGPQGPPGVSALSDGGEVGELIDQKVQDHNQAEQAHTNATSGRDYVALFQNGLV